VEDTFGHEVEDVCEAMGLVQCAGEIFDEGSEMFDHSVIIGCIITGNTEYLRQ